MIIHKVRLIENYKTWKPGRLLRVDNDLYNELMDKGLAEDCLEDTWEEQKFRFLAQNSGQIPSMKEEEPKMPKPKVNRQKRVKKLSNKKTK